MDKDFEGSLILERLAECHLIDDFYAAVDSDNLDEVISILESAEIDEETIATVIKKINE